MVAIAIVIAFSFMPVLMPLFAMLSVGVTMLTVLLWPLITTVFYIVLAVLVIYIIIRLLPLFMACACQISIVALGVILAASVMQMVSKV